MTPMRSRLFGPFRPGPWRGGLRIFAGGLAACAVALVVVQALELLFEGRLASEGWVEALDHLALVMVLVTLLAGWWVARDVDEHESRRDAWQRRFGEPPERAWRVRLRGGTWKNKSEVWLGTDRHRLLLVPIGRGIEAFGLARDWPLEWIEGLEVEWSGRVPRLDIALRGGTTLGLFVPRPRPLQAWLQTRCQQVDPTAAPAGDVKP